MSEIVLVKRETEKERKKPLEPVNVVYMNFTQTCFLTALVDNSQNVYMHSLVG